jgi:hypothetical protein
MLISNRSHLLAPTATDMRKYGKLNTICAGFHSDLVSATEGIKMNNL